MPRTTQQLTKGKPCWVQLHDNREPERSKSKWKKMKLTGKANANFKLPAWVGSLGGKLTSPELGFTDHKWNKAEQARLKQ